MNDSSFIFTAFLFSTFLRKNLVIWDESCKTLAFKVCKNSPFISVPSHTAFNLLLCFTGEFMAVVGGNTFLLSFVAPFFPLLA